VAVPAAQEALQVDPILPFPQYTGTHLTVPKFALRRSLRGELKLKLNSSTDLGGNDYVLDKSSVLLSSTLPDHVDAQGWFLEYVALTFAGEGENGTSVTRLLRGHNGVVKLRDSKSTPRSDFWYSDQDPADTTCTDAPYEGEPGILVATCGNWSRQGWCHPWGQKTMQLCNGTGLSDGYCTSPNFRPKGLKQCCHCGGGSWVAPQIPEAIASHYLFQ